MTGCLTGEDMMRIGCGLICCAVISAMALPQSGTAQVQMQRDITWKLGLEIAEAAIEACAKNNVPISVYLVLEKGIDSVQKDLLDYKPPDKSSVLDSKEKTTEANLEAKVPAKQAYAVILAAATKDTQVTVKIEGN